MSLSALFRPKTLYIIGLLSSVFMISAAYYFEIIENMEPCPLCMLQRLAVVFMGLFCLLGLFTHGWLRRIVGCFLTLSALGGAIVAGRHVWLQHLPKDQVPVCGGASFEYIMDVFPFFEGIQHIFMGSGECAEISWQLLGLSMPEWTLIYFTIWVLLSLVIVVRR